MTEPMVGDIAEDLSKVSKGLGVLKEVWSFSSRVAALQEQYRFQAIPIDKLFGAMFGFGEKPNPLAFVEKQLVEINAKLDRVLAGIDEIKVGLLGQAVLAAYLDMSDPVYLIEKYFDDLASYTEAGHTFTDAERKEFVEKVLGTRSERDGVAFCAHKIVKLGPTQSPLFFDLLFPYMAVAATPRNAREIYLKGAYVFRAIAELLNKGLILETFAVASTGGESAKVAAKMDKVTRKYEKWMKAMTENSFLPFAERLAAFYFEEEYCGGHNTGYDFNLPLAGWEPAKASILQSADELAGKLMGKSKFITLRVIPNVPPIADRVDSKDKSGAVSSGKYRWEVTGRPQTSLTKDNLLDKMQPGDKPFFHIQLNGAGTSHLPESFRKVEVPLGEGAAVPPGFDKKRLNFLRYRFDAKGVPDGAPFAFFIFNREAAQTIPSLDTKWTRYYVESDRGVEHKMHPEDRLLRQYLLDTEPGVFKLPPEGQLSPVLITYAYQRFGLGRVPS
jgi:hypothetical protein